MRLSSCRQLQLAGCSCAVRFLYCRGDGSVLLMGNGGMNPIRRCGRHFYFRYDLREYDFWADVGSHFRSPSAPTFRNLSWEMQLFRINKNIYRRRNSTNVCHYTTLVYLVINIITSVT